MTCARVVTTAPELDVLRSVRATILVTDRVGNILQAHGGGGRPLGYAPEQLEGHRCIEFIAPEDQQIMAEILGVKGLPIIANPEPFPLHIIGPDGISRVWDCMPGGFVTEETDGWIVTLTCRNEQNPSITAMECFISGGSPLEIAAAVAHHYHENGHDAWRKSALVIHRSSHPDGTVSRWRSAQPLAGTDPILIEALEECLSDPDAPWNHIEPGATHSGSALPEPLQDAAGLAGVPYCTLLASGVGGQADIVFVRLSNFEHQLQGNNRLADQAVDSVLQQALEAERSTLLLDQAMHSDPLTGIPNRLHFEEVVTAIPDAARHAALFVDIDQFKTVNDTFGHSVGDAALREVAVRLTNACRPHDLVARVGGDEFGIILRDVSDAETQHIADRVRMSMHEPFDLVGGPGIITVTVGIAPPTRNATLAELVRRADHAMLADKAPSGHTVSARHRRTPSGLAIDR